MRGVGSLTVKVEVELARVQNVRLSIPALAIDHHFVRLVKLQNLPAGVYDGTLTSYSNSGEEHKLAVRIHINPNQDNFHEFYLSTTQQEVLVRPIDPEGRTVIGAELRIEGVDQNFRTVRDWKGLSYRLKVGDYRVRVLSPDLQAKTFQLHVATGVQNYNIRIQKKQDGTRKEPRIAYTIPVEYRTAEGFWISSQTINISPTGICLIKKPLLSEASDITVRLFVPIETSPLECPARIRWSHDEEIDAPRMGVELFLTTTMRHHLAHWLDQHGKESHS